MLLPPLDYEGKVYDEELGVFLDIPAQYSGEPLWWRTRPMDYLRLVEKRAEKGIVVEDDLYPGPDELEETLGNEDLLKMFEEEE